MNTLQRALPFDLFERGGTTDSPRANSWATLLIAAKGAYDKKREKDKLEREAEQQKAQEERLRKRAIKQAEQAKRETASAILPTALQGKGLWIAAGVGVLVLFLVLRGRK